jgi:hypothetical protein
MFTLTRPQTDAAVAGEPAVPGCAWQPLTLLNGWQSAHGRYATGDPSYCVGSDGMVYLSGSLVAPNGVTGDEFAVLPANAVPAHTSYLCVYTVNGTVGTVWITPDGGLHTSGTNARQFISLAGLSFPSIGLPRWRLRPLQNGWQSAHRLYDTGDPGYSISNGAVHLYGSVRHPAGSPAAAYGSAAWTFATLPPSVPRPADGSLRATTYTAGRGRGPQRITISTRDGALNGGDGNFTSLTGISYPAEPVTWQPMTILSKTRLTGAMLTGATSVNVPAAAILNDVVYLTGTWELPADYSGEFAALPAAAKPAHKLYFLAEAHPQGAPSTYVAIRIAPTGTISVRNLPYTTSPLTISLSALSYHTLP